MLAICAKNLIQHGLVQKTTINYQNEKGKVYAFQAMNESAIYICCHFGYQFNYNKEILSRYTSGYDYGWFTYTQNFFSHTMVVLKKWRKGYNEESN